MEQQTWIGRSLNGRYKIDALLGQGGMSAVYRAYDPNLKRTVAIKLIHSHLLADEDFVSRFKREAAAVAALRHPNIVQVYDFDNEDQIHYMVLEFVPGETLQDRLKHLQKSETKMAFDQAARIIINVCDALAYAHKKGMIHRDIKPANIMLDTQGQAILMDFGIVKIMDATSHTSTGAVMGTAKYMSPEVIRSEPADERSDLYSLGVALYEMLSGEPPFEANSAMSLLMRHLNDPVPDLSTKRADVHPELVRIVNKALEKDRDDRYASAKDMADDLKRFTSTLETAPVKTDDVQAKTVKATVTSEPTVKDLSAGAPTTTNKTAPEEIQKPAKEEVPVQKDNQPPAAKTSSSPLLRYGAIGGLVLILIIAGVIFSNRASPSAAVNETSTSTKTELVEPTETLQATSTSLPTTTPTSTSVPTDTPIPATPTPSTPYVVITDIQLENNVYVVDYEVHNFPETSGQHVHMFFNTVPPEQAGSPGSGPWKLTWGSYGDPPFTQYGPTNRPAQATQMCALVANSNHSINLNSGNCVDLPDG